MSKFSKVPFGNVALSIIDGDRGTDYPKKTEFFPIGDCWFLNTSNVKSAGFDFAEMDFITAEKDAALSKGKLRRHDIVLTTRGTIGNCAYFGDKIPYDHVRINSGMVILRTDPNQLDPYFLYAFLRSEIFKIQTRTHSSGSAQPQLPIGALRNIVIPLFDLAHQRKIAAVLSALDAKIELNNRLNAELEGMAKLLYDYWFVQYDFPLSAAQATALGQPHLTGHPYRTSGGPMVYHNQLKREIPKGWKVGDLEELCSMVRGVTYSKADVRTPTDRNTVPILRATNVNNGIVDLSDLVYVTEDMPSEDQYLEKFDILVVMSSGSKAHVGKNALYCYGRKVAYGAFCSKVVPNPSNRFFVAVHMQSDPFKKYISNVCRGTSINNLTNAHITKHQLTIPPQEQLQEFEKTVSSFFETIACNHQQNQELTTLRDWLLPMLMNGQVTVR